MARQPYLIEFVRVGKTVKVSAIDPVTMIEVSMVGPANAGPETPKRNAVRKLEYVIEKKRREAEARERGLKA